jgi:hypothetical protein
MKNKNWIKLISESYIRLNESDMTGRDKGAAERLKADYPRIHPLGSAIMPEKFAKMPPNERLQLGVFAREQGHFIHPEAHPHLFRDEHFKKGYGKGPAEKDYYAPGLGDE